MRLLRALFLIALLGLALAGCGDDTKAADTDEGKPYVAAFAATAKSPDGGLQANDEEANCVGEEVVNIVGVEELERATTPDKIEDDAETDFEKLGIEVDADTADDLAGALLDCIPGVEQVKRTFAADSDVKVDDDVAECIDEAYDEDVFRKLLAVSFERGNDAVQDQKEFAGFFRAMTGCVESEAGDSFVTQAIATDLAESLDITEDEALCLSRAVVKDLGEEELQKVAAEGKDLTAEQQEQFEETLRASMPPCGLNPADYE
jgi:hypothetical protein